MEGIYSVFNKDDTDIEVNVEYMDTKRYFDGFEGKYLTRLRDMYKDKYGTMKLDIIISSDDNSFQFLLMHHDELFPGTPIVFCGVNEFEDAMLAGHELVFTGVLELLDPKASIDLALKLHPKTREVAIITETTISGSVNRKILEQLADQYKGTAEFIFLDKDKTGLTLQELLGSLRQLKETSVVFYSDFLRSRGEYIVQEVAVPQISRTSRRPVYTQYDEILGLGVVGGKLVNGHSHGQKAAEMAKRILQGAPVNTLPVYKESINSYMFDYEQLTRFNIDTDDLPEGSIVINRPFSFYSQYKALVWTVSGVIAFLILSLATISANVLKRKRAEEELKRAHDKLEVKVEERTNELSTTNLELQSEITERSKAEEKLKASEMRYKAVVEDQTEIISRFYPDGTYIFVNDVYCRFFGKSKDELIGRKWFPDAYPEDLEMIQAKLSTMSPQNPVVVIENRVFSGDKVLRWMQFVNRGLYDQHGKLLEIQSVGRDITERKKANEELMISEEKYRKLIDNSNDLIITADRYGTWTFLSPSVKSILGYEPEEMVGRLAFDFMLPEDVVSTQKAHKAVVDKAKHIQEYENRWLHKDGREVTLLWNVIELYDEQGNITGTQGVGKDITERKKTEEQVKASLKEKEVMLQEIHHRVKNNLTVIYGLLKLQADKTSADHYKELLNESINRVKTMALIHEKLYNSDSLIEIDFNDYLTELIESIFASYKIEHERIAMWIDVRDILLEVDIAIPCGLIINELVSNALKHAFPEHREGEIKVKMRIEDQDEVKLMITDNGVGMPDDLDLKKSTSLGLNMVDSLIKQLRGRLEMRSEEGVGFIITFMRHI
jgi:PAS domain S-box-containing protein